MSPISTINIGGFEAALPAHQDAAHLAGLLPKFNIDPHWVLFKDKDFTDVLVKAGGPPLLLEIYNNPNLKRKDIKCILAFADAYDLNADEIRALATEIRPLPSGQKTPAHVINSAVIRAKIAGMNNVHTQAQEARKDIEFFVLNMLNGASVQTHPNMKTNPNKKLFTDEIKNAFNNGSPISSHNPILIMLAKKGLTVKDAFNRLNQLQTQLRNMPRVNDLAAVADANFNKINEIIGLLDFRRPVVVAPAPPKGGVKVPPPPPGGPPPHPAPPKGGVKVPPPPPGGPPPHPAPPKGGVKVPPPPPAEVAPPHPAPPKGGVKVPPPPPAEVAPPHPAPPKGGVKVPPPPPAEVAPPHPAPPKGGVKVPPPPPAEVAPPHPAPPKGGVKVPPPPPAEVAPPHPAPPKGGVKVPPPPVEQPPAQPGPQVGLKPPAQPGPQAGQKPGPQAGLEQPVQKPSRALPGLPPKLDSQKLYEEQVSIRAKTKQELSHLMELHLEAKQRIVEIEAIIRKEKEKARQTAPGQKPLVGGKKPTLSPAKPNPVLQAQMSALEKAKKVLSDTFMQMQALLARFGIGSEKYMAKLAALENKPYDTQNRPSPSPEPQLRVRPPAPNRVSTPPSPVVSPAPSPRPSRVSRPSIPTPPNMPAPRRSRVQLKREMEQLAAQIEAKRNQMRLGGDALRESRAARFNAAEVAGKKKPAIRPSLLMNALNELKNAPQPVVSSPDPFKQALAAKAAERAQYEARINRKFEAIAEVNTAIRTQLTEMLNRDQEEMRRTSNPARVEELTLRVSQISQAIETYIAQDTDLAPDILKAAPEDINELNEHMIALTRYQAALSENKVPTKVPDLAEKFKSPETRDRDHAKREAELLLRPAAPIQKFDPELEAARDTQRRKGALLAADLAARGEGVKGMLKKGETQEQILGNVKNAQTRILDFLTQRMPAQEARFELYADQMKFQKFLAQNPDRVFNDDERAVLQEYLKSLRPFRPEDNVHANWNGLPRLPIQFHPVADDIDRAMLSSSINLFADLEEELGMADVDSVLDNLMAANEANAARPSNTASPDEIDNQINTLKQSTAIAFDALADLDDLMAELPSGRPSEARPSAARLSVARPAPRTSFRAPSLRASRTGMEDLDALLGALGGPGSARPSIRQSITASADLDSLLNELGGPEVAARNEAQLLLEEAINTVSARQSRASIRPSSAKVNSVIQNATGLANQLLSNPRLSQTQRQSVVRYSQALNSVPLDVVATLSPTDEGMKHVVLDKIMAILEKIKQIQNKTEQTYEFEDRLQDYDRKVAILDVNNVDDLLDMHEEIDLIEAYIDNALLLEAAQTQPTGTRQEQFDALEQVVDGILDPVKRQQVMDAYRDVAQTYPFLSNDDQERALSVIREYIVNIGEVDPDAPPKLKTPAEQLAALEHEINAFPDNEDKQYLRNLHLEIVRNMNRVSGVDEDDMLDQIDLLRDQIEMTRDKILNPEKYAPKPEEDESDAVQVAPNAMMNKVEELTAQLDDLANSLRVSPPADSRPSLVSEPSTQNLDSLLNSLRRPSTSTRPSEAVDEPIDQAHLEKFLQNVRNDLMGGPEAAAAIEKQKKAIMSLYVTPTLKSLEKLKSKSNPVALSLVSEFEKLTEELKKVILDPTGINNPQELEDKQKVLKKTIKELEKKFVDLSEQINEEAEEGKKPLSTPAIDQMLDNIRPTEQQELDALLFEASDLVKSVRHNPQPTSVEEQLRILEDLAKSLPSGTITLDPRKVGRMEKPPQVEPSTPTKVSEPETPKPRFSDEERQLLKELASDPEEGEVSSGEVSEDEMENIDDLLKDLDKE